MTPLRNLTATLLLLAGAGALAAVLLPVAFDGRYAALALAATALLLFTLPGRRRRRGLAAGSLVRPIGIVASAALLLASFWQVAAVHRELEVTFRHASEKREATLYLPRTDGPHPAVVVVPGPGAGPRTEQLYLARILAEQGIAALIYDGPAARRSTGGKEGPPARHEELADVATSALRWLSRHPEVDPAAIGVLASRDGARVAPLVARNEAFDVAFVVVVSPPYESPGEERLRLAARELREEGFPEAAVLRASDLHRQLLAYQRSGVGGRRLTSELAAAAERPWFDDAGLPPAPPHGIHRHRWGRYLTLDPVEAWRGVPCPVLAVSGSWQHEVDAWKSHAALREALERGGNRDFDGAVFGGVGSDGLRPASLTPLQPRRMPRPVRGLIVQWIHDRAAEARGPQEPGSASEPARSASSTPSGQGSTSSADAGSRHS